MMNGGLPLLRDARYLTAGLGNCNFIFELYVIPDVL